MFDIYDDGNDDEVRKHKKSPSKNDVWKFYTAPSTWNNVYTYYTCGNR
jgi:hypothetical protein